MTLFDKLKKKTGWQWPWRKPGSCRPVSFVFSCFLDVLAANNKVLEIIADIGEKLSGDFLFDRHYLEAAVNDMIASAHESIDAINRLTDNRFEQLYDIAAGMEARLKSMLSGRDDRHGPQILPLPQIENHHWPLIGGKAAHLIELRQDPKVRIPEGFVITSRTFHDLLDTNGLREKFDRFEAILADPEHNREEFEELRRQLEKGVLAAYPPAELFQALEATVQELIEAGCETPFFMAVRSSAQEEDMDFSFAGQFHSELQVRAEPEDIFHAYRKVAASLFNQKAIRYRQQLFPEGGQLSIAALCQRMIDARASGIIYSDNPAEPASRTMLAVGSFGQGQAVVEGQVPTDSFLLAKGEPPTIVSRHIASKKIALEPVAVGGLQFHELAPEQAGSPCLSDDRLLELAGLAAHLENFFKRPQDIEWTVDRNDTLYILQTRPLLVPENTGAGRPLSERLEKYEVLYADVGRIAQQGIGAGPAYLLTGHDDLQNFPDGGVLIAHKDSSYFIEVMHRAAAIITEVGTPVSHMATLCREARVPCLVAAGDVRKKIKSGDDITVDAEDRRIYKGRVSELLSYQAACAMNLEKTLEFRVLSRIQREVSRLHLVDPLIQEFRPEDCRTFHDLLRFIHETAVLELVELGRDEGCLTGKAMARPLDLPIQAGILVIDIGGGIAEDHKAYRVPYSAIASKPFKAILQGMLFPDVWHQVTMPVGFRDMMHSMLATPRDTLTGQYTGHNIAIISRNYVNLCFRFGYHFNIIDAFCDDQARNNHIYFRFLGGASDITKRSRRATLIAAILKEFDFNVQTKGDLVISRTSNIVVSEMEKTLDILGRLVGFTRQLDVQMENDNVMNRYVEAFLMGDYNIVARGG